MMNEVNLSDWSTVNQISEECPAFSKASLRNLIFNGGKNGLEEAGVITRVNRRVLINRPRFYAWIEESKFRNC